MADISVPVRPEWCVEEDRADLESCSEENRQSDHGRKKGKEFQNEVSWILCSDSRLMTCQHARFVSGVDGPVYVGPPLREEIQQQTQYILSFEG